MENHRPLSSVSFTKAEGAGNDFVLFEDLGGIELASLAPKLCDRRFGIGADGIILVEPSEIADFRMRYFNADGSEAVCNNGMRCVAKYLQPRLLGQPSFRLEVHGGAVVDMTFVEGQIQTTMGSPNFAPEAIPLNQKILASLTDTEECVDVELEGYQITAVSMGNPHCVIFTDDIDSIDLEKVGPVFENHNLFPERTNVEFVEVIDPHHVRERTWERGVGETLACGTGNCAVLSAGVKSSRLASPLTLEARGGVFQLTWSEETKHVILQGPAEVVYSGDIHLERFT